ncbi:hypothetical protein GLOTRDRAFT_81547 [Gloeophyllum trabeum ATCC 11539]|uniref:Secreted protein n=1 Tax=Gloeophyllum trabeum (strain ATCC 11539 / FP-39264 / Madison 617) TaxID=670483 RepID=S7PUI6_GLOTA|nr:uncharacterized protein GLOTRDRAFT_81547 [Gloeophyllum trabeum ATCC 11539]EPQ50977.1 hypothetical protein GLOTRDRAFT_81547 [Gloeophyllum trabeum ATCC 11539]
MRSFLILCIISPVLAVPAFIPWAAREQSVLALQGGRKPERPQDGGFEGWYDPRTNGGRMLDWATRKRGEPLNVIISAFSDPYVLTETGFHAYAKSIGFSEECMGLHYGQIHEADLGDGDGRKEEQFLARQTYFPVWGTCWESVAGGNHFRAWKQNGTLANSGAWFLAVSKEEHSGKHHTIIEDGYNIGRDLLVERAAAGSRWNGMWWLADVEWREGLLEPGNHSVNHGIEQDGRVAILTVQRL